MMFVASSVVPAALPGLLCVSSERHRDPQQQQYSEWACLQKIKTKHLRGVSGRRAASSDLLLGSCTGVMKVDGTHRDQ